MDSTFQPVDGGLDRACRGASISDNRPSNYKVVPLQSLEACEQRCQNSHGCVAIEYSQGRCELWLKKVQATRSLGGLSGCSLDIFGTFLFGRKQISDGSHDDGSHLCHLLVTTRYKCVLQTGWITTAFGNPRASVFSTFSACLFIMS